jgi:hypothetical protein
MSTIDRVNRLIRRAQNGAALSAADYDATLNALDTGVISVRDFGVTPGTHDNQAALHAMRNWCEANRAASGVTIYFPPGRYRYSVNKWIPMCDQIEIIGYGAQLECTASIGGHINWDPFYMGNPFSGRPEGNPGGTPSHMGYAIQTQVAGSNTITLIDPAHADFFSPGDRILIYGFDHQSGGYAPNMRYRQWLTITGKSGSTLSIHEHLRNTYKSTWRGARMDPADPLTVYGPAKIVNLIRYNGGNGARDNLPYRYPRKFIIRGVEFMRNTTAPQIGANASGLSPIAEDVHLEDIRHNGMFWPMIVRQCTVKNSYIANCHDLDKFVDRLVFDGCRLDDWVGAATGINELIVRNCDVRGKFFLGARRWTVENCIVNYQGETWDEDRGPFQWRQFPTSDRVIIRNNVIHNRYGGAAFAFMNNEKTITVGVGSAGSFTMPNTTGIPLEDILSIRKGTVIRNANWSRRARVQELDWNGTQFVITHDGGVTFQNGEVLYYPGVGQVEHEGNQLWRAGVLQDQDYAFCQRGGPQYEKRRDWIYRGRPPIVTVGGLPQAPMRYTGYATRITLRVLQASTLAPRYRFIVFDGSGTARTLISGDTSVSGSYAVADLVAGTVNYYGTWTNTGGYATPLVQPILDIERFTISTTGLGLPSYGGNQAAAPLFEIKFDGSAPII